MRETPVGADPLGPDNRLVFSLGPLTGHAIIGGARHSLGTKSPLTGGFAESEAGGYWGAELKKAGFDFIVIQGRSPSPVYLWVHDGEAQLRDASAIWGKGTLETQRTIREELGDKQVRVAGIGPAGERMVSYACVAHDVNHMAGRNGMGAVMGSKLLKAVAVRGRKRPAPADPETLKNLSRWMGQNFKQRIGFWNCGTGSTMIAYESGGNLPVRNFKGGRFPPGGEHHPPIHV